MIAVYARQSVEKKDSISVESQISFCSHEAHGSPFQTYIDRGFSGKNTNRPAFEALMKDIQRGQIHCVVVYKLDRISRSILDFANMMEQFLAHRVEFISSTEKFDTSTPIGRAMLNICVVFAQLERETIQKRVTDSYYSRSRCGFYMGGRVPYGFALQPATIGGVHTASYFAIKEEAQQVQEMFRLYAQQGVSLGDILRQLEAQGQKQLRGTPWSTQRISEILHNPIYVRADMQMYRFFCKEGITLINEAEEFVGTNGCYLYGGGEGAPYVVLAPHEGLVTAAQWLACHQKCKDSKQFATTGKGKNSWLTGKVKCKQCGYALTVKKSKSKAERYFLCSGKAKSGVCAGAGTLYAQELEAFVLEEMRLKVQQLGPLLPLCTPLPLGEENRLQMHLQQVEQEVEALVEKVPKANDALLGHINARVEQLEGTRAELLRQLSGPPQSTSTALQVGSILWQELSFSCKKQIAEVLLFAVRVGEGEVELLWRV